LIDEKREMLRHTVATVAYRAGKTLRNAPPDFAAFSVGPTSRTPLQILAHIGDLFEWALTMAEGNEVWHDAEPLVWTREVERFFTTLRAFDDYLASGVPLAAGPEQLFQGPVADALTHAGQIAMLRRMANSPVRGENYFRAEIVVGRVGRDQAPGRREFD